MNGGYVRITAPCGAGQRRTSRPLSGSWTGMLTRTTRAETATGQPATRSVGSTAGTSPQPVPGSTTATSTPCHRFSWGCSG